MAIRIALVVVLVNRLELSQKTIIALFDHYWLMIWILLRLSNGNNLTHLQTQSSNLFGFHFFKLFSRFCRSWLCFKLHFLRFWTFWIIIIINILTQWWWLSDSRWDIDWFRSLKSAMKLTGIFTIFWLILYRYML